MSRNYPEKLIVHGKEFSDKWAKALEESIEHWEKNVKRHAEDLEMKLGRSHCPLCIYSKFMNDDRYFCVGCPIYDYTGRQDCGGTPYCDVTRTGEAPQVELDWLIELRMNGTPDTKRYGGIPQ